MGSCCTCLDQTSRNSTVHPNTNHSAAFSSYKSPKKQREEKFAAGRSPRGTPRGSPKNSPKSSRHHYRSDPPPDFVHSEHASGKKPLFSSKSFGDSSAADPQKPSRTGSRKKVRQEEHQFEVTTVQTIKETRIIHIERDSGTSGDNSRVDSLPQTEEEAPETANPAPSSEPLYSNTIATNQISKEYFPIKTAKKIPEELLKSSSSNFEIPSSESLKDLMMATNDGSVGNKHATMETPYTRDCESPAPRYPRHASLATTSIMDSSITDVEVSNPAALKCASQKLRMLLDALTEPGPVDKASLIDSISYACSVLDYNYQLKKKSAQALDLEDSDSFAESLSRATSVDNLVRDWLVHTFTRSTSRAGGYIDDKNANKKNFKSVANVIRISIMVDRFRRSLYRITIPDNLKPFLKRFCYWDFDVFELHRVSAGHSLRFVCFEALSRFGICTRFKIRRTVMEKFLNRLEEGYCLNRNPYHNVLHGADVTQGTVAYLAVTNLIEWLSELEIFTVVIASAIHDFEHTGTTNNFHINTKSDLALFYNDRSVLENYHVSAVFRFMNKDPETNILTGLTSQEYKEMRSLLIEIVLNTDMQFHFAQVKNMRSTLSLLDADPSPSAVTIDKAKVLSLLVHSSDVGHPGRSWAIHLKWTKMLCQEFFNQGDREKSMEMAISPLCDRLTTNIASSQIGFIDFIVNPTFDVVVDMIERILNPLFLQHKARSSANILATVDEVTESNGESNGEHTEPLAGPEDYAAASDEAGEPCDFIPFKWDARQAALKINRFYSKNIDTNKANWRKHIEDEVNDPMFFKRFERDPVIELGWRFSGDEKEENDGEGGEDGGDNKDKEDGSSEEERKKKKKKNRRKSKLKDSQESPLDDVEQLDKRGLRKKLQRMKTEDEAGDGDAKRKKKHRHSKAPAPEVEEDQAGEDKLGPPADDPEGERPSQPELDDPELLFDSGEELKLDEEKSQKDEVEVEENEA